MLVVVCHYAKYLACMQWSVHCIMHTYYVHLCTLKENACMVCTHHYTTPSHNAYSMCGESSKMSRRTYFGGPPSLEGYAISCEHMVLHTTHVKCTGIILMYLTFAYHTCVSTWCCKEVHCVVPDTSHVTLLVGVAE